MKYIVKFSYNMIEERRRYVRKMKAKRAKAEGQPKSRVSARHSDRKKTCLMIAKQIQSLKQQYSRGKIEALPDHIKPKLSSLQRKDTETSKGRGRRSKSCITKTTRQWRQRMEVLRSSQPNNNNTP
jgi:hypothetical protein